MKYDDELPTPEAADLLALTADLADRELAPRAAAYEARGEFPREVIELLGKAGLTSLPYPREYGGGGQPYEVYLRVIERLAYRWLAVAESVHLHVVACYPTAAHGTPRQREELLPGMLDGSRIGAVCLSEAAAGSDLGAMSTRAEPDGDDYLLRGTKSWTTHAGVAGFYNVYCRTGGPGIGGISCLLVDADTEGVHPQRPEKKMGVSALPTAQMVFDGARVPASRLIGRRNRGIVVASAGFDLARLGIAACAVGLARAALDYAVAYAKQREQFGSAIISFQGIGFLLADLATQVSAARALLLSAARLRDRGRPFSLAASQAKLFATDTAMRVTVEAVQVLGGYGYVTDHPVERWMREAKLLQIIEGTNQIQRLAISQAL
ncbi:MULTISPECIES: acyl-CoA dehydrogenase family protein [unclassified Streptomyces]|uniref:acyl-CoA dehydrogenase family protein n=1 Tax=unclassified Streptomyces TaxID=2593676 RepID=UPI002E2D0806|nr:acyl-CoA dehydrogenase family protein [Streptomyces sp. NBC_00223]